MTTYGNGDVRVDAAPPALPEWGSILQEKFVNAHRVEGCPTMDLIAILTHDRQLLVHRTISWQRTLHVKPSEVFFTMETMAWSPDGMRLAVGCDEGELLVFPMASTSEGSKSGVEIKPHTSDVEGLHHETRITCMYWVRVREQDTVSPPPSEILRLRDNTFVPGASGECFMATTEGTSVLATADASGRIGLWWNGLVLVAMISVVEYLDLGAAAKSLTTSGMLLATDLSSLFLNLTDNTENSAPQRHVVRLDLRGSVAAVQRHLTLISRVGYEVRSIFESVRATLRQITSEWKNALRVFELKMSLIGSLYEKYGYDEPPQVDMLGIIASGIIPPGLAQYFAQDIQEMSVIRMQKAFFTGCDTIQRLISSKVIIGLQRVLIEVSELRGAVKWNHAVFNQTLGFATNELDSTIDNVSLLITEMETLGQVLNETRQDYALLFSWLIERIRIHSNEASSGRVGGALTGQQAAFEGATAKSLLNTRRLTEFLENAAVSARAFKAKQANAYQVDVSFGNPISKRLAASSSAREINQLEARWNDVMTRMACSLSKSHSPHPPVVVSLPQVIDVAFHSRWMERDTPTMLEDDDMGEDHGPEATDGVDWDSLLSVQDDDNSNPKRSASTLVALLKEDRVILLSCPEGGESERFQLAALSLPKTKSSEQERPRQVSFYGGVSSGKQEQLVVRCCGEQDDLIYLLGYDDFVHWTSTVEERSASLSGQLQHCSMQSATSATRCRARNNGRELSATNCALLVPEAARGIICVVSAARYLTVFDAEEDADEEEDNDDGGESEDNDEGDL